jgi:hypothetical protein
MTAGTAWGIPVIPRASQARRPIHGNIISGAWEKRLNGAGWEHDFDLTYRRAG